MTAKVEPLMILTDALETQLAASRAFAEALKAKRKELGMSHEKLAKATGMSRSSISMIESGQRSPSLISCHALCDALGESVGSMARAADALLK